ncbi:MAG: hypothetical protein KatS3mg023_1052 [Armatimonadota bacterium]|nr:MAG: hypothetical protein KatS3mg023_1052 [Armatimonadota bacterium]
MTETVVRVQAGQCLSLARLMNSGETPECPPFRSREQRGYIRCTNFVPP